MERREEEGSRDQSRDAGMRLLRHSSQGRHVAMSYDSSPIKIQWLDLHTNVPF